MQPGMDKRLSGSVRAGWRTILGQAARRGVAKGIAGNPTMKGCFNMNDWTSGDGRIRILNCDCMEFMKGLPDKAFEIACVDPPYGVDMANRAKTMKWGAGRLPTKNWDAQKTHAGILQGVAPRVDQSNCLGRQLLSRTMADARLCGLGQGRRIPRPLLC